MDSAQSKNIAPSTVKSNPEFSAEIVVSLMEGYNWSFFKLNLSYAYNYRINKFVFQVPR